MNIKLNDTAWLNYVLVMENYASINLTDGTRIELSADLMKKIASEALKSAEAFSSQSKPPQGGQAGDSLPPLMRQATERQEKKK